VTHLPTCLTPNGDPIGDPRGHAGSHEGSAVRRTTTVAPEGDHGFVTPVRNGAPHLPFGPLPPQGTFDAGACVPARLSTVYDLRRIVGLSAPKGSGSVAFDRLLPRRLTVSA
jgi:hypothetical protein